MNYIVPEVPEYFYCEHKSVNGWKPIQTRDMAWVKLGIENGFIRVLKLDELQLEELGWRKHELVNTQFIHSDNNTLLFIKGDNIVIEKLRGGTLYRGKCPTINEFLTITRLLDIVNVSPDTNPLRQLNQSTGI